MYCNVHHNLWPRLNLQSEYESHIPLYKIDVTQKSIKDELTQSFIFSLYFILFSLALFMQYIFNHMCPSPPLWCKEQPVIFTRPELGGFMFHTAERLWSVRK